MSRPPSPPPSRSPSLERVCPPPADASAVDSPPPLWPCWPDDAVWLPGLCAPPLAPALPWLGLPPEDAPGLLWAPLLDEELLDDELLEDELLEELLEDLLLELLDEDEDDEDGLLADGVLGVGSDGVCGVVGLLAEGQPVSSTQPLIAATASARRRVRRAVCSLSLLGSMPQSLPQSALQALLQ